MVFVGVDAVERVLIGFVGVLIGVVGVVLAGFLVSIDGVTAVEGVREGVEGLVLVVVAAVGVVLSGVEGVVFNGAVLVVMVVSVVLVDLVVFVFVAFVVLVVNLVFLVAFGSDRRLAQVSQHSLFKNEQMPGYLLRNAAQLLYRSPMKHFPPLQGLLELSRQTQWQLGI